MAMSVAVLFLLSSVSSVLSQDPSAANNYETIYQTLARCSVPTEDIFKRTYDRNIDRVVPSDYDNFCSIQDGVNGFMCNYYRQLVGTYFKEYCNGKQRMDHSAQWLRFYSDPGQPCQYLVDNLRYQLDNGSLMNVFKDEAACQAVCFNRNKFCLGFAFALQVYQSQSKDQLTDATITGSDGTNGAETGAEKTETVAIGDSPGSQTSQLANNVNTAAGDDTRKEDNQSPPDTSGGVNNPPPVNTATGTAEGVNDPAPVNTATGTAQAVGSGEPHEPMNIPAGPPGKSEDETSPGGVSVSSPKEGVNGDQEEAGSQGDKEGKEPQEKEEHDLFDILRNNGNATADEANITGGQRNPVSETSGNSTVSETSRNSTVSKDKGITTVVVSKTSGKPSVPKDTGTPADVVAKTSGKPSVPQDTVAVVTKTSGKPLVPSEISSTMAVVSKTSVPLDNNSPLEPGDIQDENYGSSSDSYSVDLPFAKKPDAGDNVDDFILPEDAHNDEQTVYQPEINQPVEKPEAKPETKPEIKPSAQEHTNDRNIMKEEELRILEEESSSSHFLAYTLTAIILIMVTYIMYHNKQKIVAIIVEGKGGSNGRRRRYNQNV